jgi:(1->4)-alpha-D-glucan 1-alpha-D-glucosylmutase
MTPRSTYRVQFHKDFPFDAGAELAPYLAKLGVSHLYASPILTARAGSMHGYDVVDHTQINPELGGEAAFVRMAEALRASGLGLIVDIVPNHMAVGGGDNPWWLDVLENGAASRFAQYFDIDFDSAIPNLKGKVLAPFLGDTYETVLQSGDLKVIRDERLGKVAVAYHDHRFPIRPQDRDTVAADVTRYGDPNALHLLLERQNFVLAWWRTAGDQINWRRFFDITELAALRVELTDVFEAVHAKIFDLYRGGLIDGVRVDHVDGLTRPARYCRLLRKRLDELGAERTPRDRAYIVVEKILGGGEALPDDWDIDGTTGYDFMNQISALQHAPGGVTVLNGFWGELSGRSPDFEPEELMAREEMLRTSFDHQLSNTAAAFYDIAQTDGSRDITLQSINRALIYILRHLRVYRTYATGMTDSPPPGPAFEQAVAAAKDEAPTELLSLDFVARTVAADNAIEPVRKFNQLAAPVAAKAVEDTAFYRYGRLLSRNDVGFDPARLSLDVQGFHAAASARATRHPSAMLTTATHDHKRGEDVRARLAVLSEIPERWRFEVERWFALNDAIRPEALAKDDEYQLYQTLLGIWPLVLADTDDAGLAALSERLSAWRVKSLREAKLRSSWAQPDIEYEDANIGFIDRMLERHDSPFVTAMQAFAESIASAGAFNSLVQMVLRLTLPGVPDMFQGTEYWDLSLVDPDNRRPVNFGERAASLERTVTTDWRDGTIKQVTACHLLNLRRRFPGIFSSGDYRPLEVRGLRQDHAIAFARRDHKHELIVAVPIRCAAALVDSHVILPPSEWWGDTHIDTSPSSDIEMIFGENTGNGLMLNQMALVPALVVVSNI